MKNVFIDSFSGKRYVVADKFNTEPIGVIKVFGTKYEYYDIVLWRDEVNYIIKYKNDYLLVDKLFTLLSKTDIIETKFADGVLAKIYSKSLFRVKYGEIYITSEIAITIKSNDGEKYIHKDDLVDYRKKIYRREEIKKILK